MKILILSTVVLALSGCVVAPAPYQDRNVIVYPAVRVSPTVEVVYSWDPIQYRYFWVDARNSRHYMPHDWRHPHGHKPRGYDRWDRR